MAKASGHIWIRWNVSFTLKLGASPYVWDRVLIHIFLAPNWIISSASHVQMIKWVHIDHDVRKFRRLTRKCYPKNIPKWWAKQQKFNKLKRKTSTTFNGKYDVPYETPRRLMYKTPSRLMYKQMNSFNKRPITTWKWPRYICLHLIYCATLYDFYLHFPMVSFLLSICALFLIIPLLLSMNSFIHRLIHLCYAIRMKTTTWIFVCT